MMKTTLCRSAVILVVVSALGAIAACSGPDLPDHERVSDRAQARWDALVDKDGKTAWNYYTPGFRDTYPQPDFDYDIRRRPVRWLDAEVRGADCQEDRCTVRVWVEYDAPSAPQGQRSVKLSKVVSEEWLKLDGQWWYAEE
ncbi:hypothetical protein [Wenzhouxiangella sp. EGI_FJ10305]|uniref:hypothetical protein n=1 Tax=Wenzhouxiangella sp. EGI_FJ10305 TaxID=3243768 RepID=UPI0035D6593E